MAEIVSDTSVSKQTSDTNAEHEHLLYELESSDTNSVALVLRAIYDGDQYPKFMERLDARIKNHDKDIERMCNFHYQGFIDSIRELLQVRIEAQKLKEEVVHTNDILQSMGQALFKKGEELIQCRQVQRNIALAIESLSLCLPVLEMYSKLQRQMKEKRYYPALKTLELLEHTYLPRVGRYRFTQVMCDTIPKQRESIRSASMSDLKDFLQTIREHSAKIGTVAMKHASEQTKIDPTLIRKLKKKGSNSTDEEMSEDEKEDNEEETDAKDRIDFSPVYRCLHIYSVLGQREVFESYYRKQRRKQAILVLDLPQNMQETVEGYKKYFEEIVGFFVVEDHILNTAPGLVSRQYLDELWEMALSKVMASLRTNSTSCEDADQVLQIKKLIVLFSETLKVYGFPETRLYELLLKIREKYNSILMRKCAEIFPLMFNEDNYTPIEVDTQTDYDEILRKFPFKDEKLEKAQFPKRFPFSAFVPKVYCQVLEFIHICLKFTEDLNLSQTEIDDLVRKSTNLLLTKTLNDCLSSLIMKPNLSLLQLIQITINANYLEDACICLEEDISNITGASRDGAHVARLQGTAMFKGCRENAEAQIYLKLNEKINEFLELANYDWMMNEPKGHASSYLMDLIAFLQSTFMSFTNLSDKVAKTACKSACGHVAESLMKFLLDFDIKQISMGALQQFNLDLIQCEQFANSEPVPGFKDGSLQQIFSELRQMLDLFMTWDWSTYFHDYGKSDSKYFLVSPQNAVVLLEKMKDADKKKNNLFASLKKNERDKKRLLDTVLKQLRQLINGAT